MSVFGKWSAQALAGAAEKSVARIGDADLRSAYEQRARSMSASERGALLDAIFEAFRDRGEASQDAAEDAGTTLERVEAGDLDAIRSILDYAAASPGLLKEATMLFVERQPQYADALPAVVTEAMMQRLSEGAAQ